LQLFYHNRQKLMMLLMIQLTLLLWVLHLVLSFAIFADFLFTNEISVPQEIKPVILVEKKDIFRKFAVRSCQRLGQMGRNSRIL